MLRAASVSHSGNPFAFEPIDPASTGLVILEEASVRLLL
jgi:hypothetical protein